MSESIRWARVRIEDLLPIKVNSGMIGSSPIKRLLPVVAILLGWNMAAWAATPAPLTTLNAIHAVTNDQASLAPPVAFEATVSYFRGYDRLLFVQDSGVAIFVLPPTADGKLLPGDRVLVRGAMQESFRPIVAANNITLR
jgi:hypothetical protein